MIRTPLARHTPLRRGTSQLRRHTRLRQVSAPELSHASDCRCGVCHCGCGQRTPVAKKSDASRGHRGGEPTRFIVGHYRRRPEQHASWSGGRVMDKGYVLIHDPLHWHAGAKGYVFEHVRIASDVLGRPLPPNAVVHHVNGKKSDNRRQNLVICENQSYHKLLHAREKALRACGNANLIRCCYCREWDRRENLYVSPPSDSGVRSYHQRCRREHDASRSPLPKRNPERRARLYARNFGEYADLIRSMPCAVKDCKIRPVEPAHVIHCRGMGGCNSHRRFLVPLCRAHHAEEQGRTAAFEARYGLDLAALAARLWAEHGDRQLVAVVAGRGSEVAAAWDEVARTEREVPS